MDFKKESMRIANNEAYLDKLFKIYHTTPDLPRPIKPKLWQRVSNEYNRNDNIELVRACLALKLFPIKDAYVAYLRRDKTAIDRNKETVDRLAGQIRQLDLAEIKEICSSPPETNRQMGQRFREWLNKGSMGVTPVSRQVFLGSKGNAILDGDDKELKAFAAQHLGYQHDKGLDLVARFKGKYVIGEAKFITETGGHQKAQLNDALTTLHAPVNPGVIKVAILDGIIYIPKQRSAFHKRILQETGYIMSALVLNPFLYQL